MNLKVIPLLNVYTRDEVENDKEYIYLFTDNAIRKSGYNKISTNSWYVKKYGESTYPNTTQALIRGLENAFPITTMVNNKRLQWQNKDIDTYQKIIDDEISDIINSLPKYKGIKYSAQKQFGDGSISNMKYEAPLCWYYLNKKLLEIGIDNERIITTR